MFAVFPCIIPGLIPRNLIICSFHWSKRVSLFTSIIVFNPSNDAIYRKDVLETVVERVVDTWNKSEEHKPQILEYGKHRSNLGREWNWLVTGMPDMLCAIPKREIVVSDDDPGIFKLPK